MERFLIAVLGTIAVILALILASHAGTRSPASDNQPRRKGAGIALLASVGVLLVAAVGAAGYSALQWRTVAAQKRALEAQMRDMAARQHRAWLYATPSLDGPMIIKGHEVSLAVRYKLENRGDAPAADAEIAALVIPHVEGDVVALQKPLCQGRRGESGITRLTQDSLLPGQSLEVTHIAGTGADLVGRRTAAEGSGRKFWWVGCVAYKSLGDPARHHSGFIYEIAESGAGPRGIVPISLADHIVPKERLVIMPYPGGGFSAD